MDELVKLVAARTGISEDQARTAVDLVINQLKTRLPAPIAGQLDSALSGGSTGLLGALGGMLGGGQ